MFQIECFKTALCWDKTQESHPFRYEDTVVFRMCSSALSAGLQMGSPARRDQAFYPPGQLCYELHWDTETTASSGETPCGGTQV